jgi:Initiator Replication protein
MDFMKKDILLIKKIQEDKNYVILDNPFASPRFVKKLSKTEYKVAKTDTYTLKLFAELLSRLNYSLIKDINVTSQVEVIITIKDFLNQIGVEHSKGYNYVIEAASYLKTLIIQWKENGTYKESVFVSYSEHNMKTGKITLLIPQPFVKRILDVGMKENFSFLKQNLFKLENNQAIKLYQFFKSWLNKGKYETELERFKEMFGYNTSGYQRFNTFENRVILPAISEINIKTDIDVRYELLGDNLNGLKPRVKGMVFYITEKKTTKDLHLPIITTSLSPTISKENIMNTQSFCANNPNEIQLNALAEKLKLNTAEVQTLITELSGNYIRVYEVLQGCINESKKTPIKSPMAYMLTQTSIRTLGVGLWEIACQNLQKEQRKQVAKKQVELENKINEEYQLRKKNLFIKCFQEADPMAIKSYYESLKKETNSIGFNPYINLQTLELKDLGKYMIGEQLANQKSNTTIKRQNYYVQEIATRYGYQIAYNEQDEVLVLGLINNI